MSEIKSVAIAGVRSLENTTGKWLTSSQASGNLGSHILKALVDANFNVTVLTRSNKPGLYDAKVKVVEVDYASVESLTAALKGIDALVCSLGHAGLESQTLLIDASVAAGVKRFIPSEYGSCTTNPKVASFPIYVPMFKIKNYLEEKAKEGQLTWTVLACGAFLEFIFNQPFLLDYANHKATLYDEGDNRTSSTSMPNVGKAIAGILKNAKATENKIVRVSEVILSQNQLLGMAEEVRPEIKWEISKVQTSALLKEGLDGVAAGDFSMPTMMKILSGTALAGDTYGSAFYETDNELLDIKEMLEDHLRTLVVEKLSPKLT